ncbi:hypothetical protein P4679_25000 [Priestia megaterium]|uniref:hypothetical protein n=1 Tax=Priestia megaterium TaxID=1404 RepID=UPI002E21EF64|nr:hypothetical protein [Priestia megaterium]
MRNYLIKLISSLIIIFLILGIAEWIDIKWLQEGSHNRIFFLFLVSFAVSWTVSYFLKKKNKKSRI